MLKGRGGRVILGIREERSPMRYGPFETTVCRIIGKEPHGYSVYVPNGYLKALLVTSQKYNRGDELDAAWICLHYGTILLADLYRCPRPSDGAEIVAFPQKKVPVE
jgi:hypothetical protein